ncbi:hypothetical protein [Sphingomonas sanxanigenens]|uniref:Uncharacterized protein n=1 Tax=Sphingomonas sanxanigenens DSM 19645 = NX02 TaxID=1123269 RepID=W0AE96_9SPHN|nr:hypothetical protein [Sphingomonas sanxanigenens]AHE55416.1 hypothetical protein NX02_18735 [Sphingomonas sanxanigenens DSM 19645 = NX02]
MPPLPSALSALEAEVVRIGLLPRERPAILAMAIAGPLRRLLHTVFGTSAARPLADARLEALRAMAAAIGRGHEPGAELVTAFTAAGWTAVTIDLIRAIATGTPRSSPRVWRRKRRPVAAIARRGKLAVVPPPAQAANDI